MKTRVNKNLIEIENEFKENITVIDTNMVVHWRLDIEETDETIEQINVVVESVKGTITCNYDGVIKTLELDNMPHEIQEVNINNSGIELNDVYVSDEDGIYLTF